MLEMTKKYRKSPINFKDAKQVNELLARVRSQPMKIQHVTKGVAADYLRPSKNPKPRKFLFNWISQ